MSDRKDTSNTDDVVDNTPSLESCDGYKRLSAAVEDDQMRSPGFHDYRAKLAWAIERARHYADKTGLTAVEILNSWERSRNYWYMNFYQDSKQPLIEGDSVRVFDTVEALKESIGSPQFRCPACSGVSKDAYTCDAGTVVDGKPCDWKVYGLFGHLGKGVYVFVKSETRGQNIFKPVAWETT